MSETRSRRRGEQLEAAILDAAWAELQEAGYRGLTIERVASRAGTSKPVIYRRWANRAELVLAAWGRRMPNRPEPVNTGALRSDLIELFTRISRRANDMMGEMIAGVMAEAFRDPEVTALLQERLKAAPLAEGMRRILARAAERGEMPPVELPPRAARLPLDLVRNEGMTCGGPIREEAITEMVDEVYLPLLRGLSATDS
ncbi:TetR/AcrR family transcriptional regulator [Amycolatopsis alkalitolerans]|uniref:TetR/AcrR family transcriptional regulator n=1 Tax=Amycolatopsis alkalitolerans TaxID=2547244 RepID=A0A5C4M4W9_9PSEU|nr:TetR/AcrR family transcriptional regulator [Amycolatopsis alkalitolerans]TNC27762.1 TetR/AcrR family transcriptional regulator [Amycolatopsis alkalitolerans]